MFDNIKLKIKENHLKVINNLGFKRLASKVSDIEETEIPKSTLPNEFSEAEAMYIRAFLYQKIQETAVICIKKLEKDIKILKKEGSQAQLEIIKHEECKPWKEVESNKHIDSTIKTKNESCFKSQVTAANKPIIIHNRTKIADNYDVRKTIDSIDLTIKNLKKYGIKARRNKQKEKEEIKDFFKKLKYAEKLSLKYGPLKCNFDGKGNEISCEYNEKWYKHRNDRKLTEYKIKLLNNMKPKAEIKK